MLILGCQSNNSYPSIVPPPKIRKPHLQIVHVKRFSYIGSTMPTIARCANPTFRKNNINMLNTRLKRER